MNINSEVPFEFDPEGGCFVKFTFPRELVILSDYLKAYTGDGYFITENGNDIVPVDKDYDSETKWAIFRACTYKED